MPLINVYLRKGTTVERRRAIAAAMRKGMIDIPASRTTTPSGKPASSTPRTRSSTATASASRSDDAAIVRLSFNARPAVAKQALFEAIAETIVAAGLDRKNLFMTMARPRRRTGGPTRARSTPSTAPAVGEHRDLIVPHR